MDYKQFELALGELSKHIQYLHSQIRNIAYDVYKMDVQNSVHDVDQDIMAFQRAAMRMYMLQLQTAELKYYQLRADNIELCIEQELNAIDRDNNPEQLPYWELYNAFE